MRKFWRGFCSMFVAAAFFGTLLISGCAVRGEYRVYDPEYHDYHRWNHTENDYYVRWEDETHRRHRDFRQRDQQEQDQYWQWRHQHENDHHDHNHSHGH
jgi:hypothetical protein